MRCWRCWQSPGYRAGRPHRRLHGTNGKGGLTAGGKSAITTSSGPTATSNSVATGDSVIFGVFDGAGQGWQAASHQKGLSGRVAN